MQAVSSALLRAKHSAGRQSLDQIDGDSDLFSRVLGTRVKDRLNANKNIQAALDRLNQRFPNLSVTPGESSESVKNADKKVDETKDAEDKAAISEPVLAGMRRSEEFAKKVEEILSSLFERPAGTDLMSFGGATVTRSVSITVTTVRYGELHYGQEGDLLGGTELRTGFHDRLADMLREFFGLEKPEDAAGEESAAGEAAKETEKAETGKNAVAPWGSLTSVTMWSMEIWYSSSLISSMTGENQNANATEAMRESWNYSASFSATFAQGFTSYLMPQALLGMGGGMAGMSPFLQNSLAGLGLESDGFKSEGDGYLIHLRQRRNLLAELMELYQSKMGQSAPVAAPESEEAGAAAAVEEPVAEEPVAPVDAAMAV